MRSPTARQAGSLAGNFYVLRPQLELTIGPRAGHSRMPSSLLNSPSLWRRRTEAFIRLELLQESGLIKPRQLTELLKEANEIVAINVAARKTAKQAA